MAVKKRGNFYWYSFSFKGKLIQQSTRQGNKHVAEEIAAAHRTQLLRGERGIDDVKVPTLAEFAPRFEGALQTLFGNKPLTISFYTKRLRQLLRDPELPNMRLDQIEGAVIEEYKTRRRQQTSRRGRPLAIGTINRELATLRRLLGLAAEWKVIRQVPKVRLLPGERIREFVLNHQIEPQYLETARQRESSATRWCPPLRDVAVLILDTGVRCGEAGHLEWADVRLEPAVHSRHGYIVIRQGKSRNAKRTLSLTPRVAAMLKARKAASTSQWVFGETGPLIGTSLDHIHEDVRNALKLSPDFVIHSLRHTMLTRLGEAGADAFTIMRIAGHGNIQVSARYVHPTPESLERAFERLNDLNVGKAEQIAVGAGTLAKSSTVKNARSGKSPQVVQFKMVTK